MPAEVEPDGQAAAGDLGDEREQRERAEAGKAPMSARPFHGLSVPRRAAVTSTRTDRRVADQVTVQSGAKSSAEAEEENALPLPEAEPPVGERQLLASAPRAGTRAAAPGPRRRAARAARAAPRTSAKKPGLPLVDADQAALAGVTKRSRSTTLRAATSRAISFVMSSTTREGRTQATEYGTSTLVIARRIVVSGSIPQDRPRRGPVSDTGGRRVDETGGLHERR